MDLQDQVFTIIKLLYMNTMSKINVLETELVKSELQKKAYEALDGKKTVAEIAQIAGYSSKKSLESMLPTWERKGLILSFGKGAAKKYMNIYNLDL